MAYEYLDDFTDDLFADWQRHELKAEKAEDQRTRLRESHYADRVMETMIHYYRVILRKPKYVSQRHNFQDQLRKFAPKKYEFYFTESGKWKGG